MLRFRHSLRRPLRQARMAPRETSTMANIAPVSIPTLPLGEILGVEEKRALVVDAEGVRIEVLIGIAGRTVKRGLKLDTSAVVELCDSAVVPVMNVERERDIGGSTARRLPPLLQSARFIPYGFFSGENDI